VVGGIADQLAGAQKRSCLSGRNVLLAKVDAVSPAKRSYVGAIIYNEQPANVVNLLSHGAAVVEIPAPESALVAVLDHAAPSGEQGIQDRNRREVWPHGRINDAIEGRFAKLFPELGYERRGSGRNC
jgi:hypothetical protein